MTAPPSVAYVALGSNVGDRAAHLRRATCRLAAHPRVHVEAASPVYESAALALDPGEEQPDFLNAVLRLRTCLASEALLALLLHTEAEAGRTRTRRWAPRTLDLDLLVYGSLTWHTERLTLPHPRLAERRFVLRPLADLAPNLHVPAPFEATAAELLRRCPEAAPLRRTGHVLLD